MNRIAVDQDQVLADLLGEWIKRYNIDYNDTLTPEDIKCWNLCKYVKSDCGRDIYNYLKDEDLYRNLEIIEDSQEVLYEISKKYEIFIVTAAMEMPSSFKGKYEWLRKHFDFIPSKNIVFCGDKSIVNADYLIDDAVHNLETFKGEGLLFSAPHNLNENRFRRVNGWREIRELFLGQNEIVDKS